MELDWQDILRKVLFDLFLVGVLSTAAVYSTTMIQQALPTEEGKNA